MRKLRRGWRKRVQQSNTMGASGPGTELLHRQTQPRLTHTDTPRGGGRLKPWRAGAWGLRGAGNDDRVAGGPACVGRAGVVKRGSGGLVSLRTVSGHSRPGQPCRAPTRTARVLGPAGACPGAPCSAARATNCGLALLLVALGPHPRLSLSPPLRSKARALAQMTSCCRPGPFPPPGSRNPRWLQLLQA